MKKIDNFALATVDCQTYVKWISMRDNIMLPQAFVEQMRMLLGDGDLPCFLESLNGEPVVSIRRNPRKQPPLFDGELVPWCSAGRYLLQRPLFTLDPLLHAGCYYVQEASSMFLQQALSQQVRGAVTMLDMCAAPGGKSTHALSLLPDGSLLVANELIRQRAQILVENIVKWGCPNVVVTQNNPSDFACLGSFFDVVLVDAPCSGEGMFRKDAVAVSEWSPENVENCRLRQRRVLSDSWACLKEGGLLIYSTCTYNVGEDEENVVWLMDEMGALSVEVDVNPDWGITGNLAQDRFAVYRFLPHRTRGEGFFMALLRKPKTGADEIENMAQRQPKKVGKRIKKSEAPACVKEWLRGGDFTFEIENEQITATPAGLLEKMEFLRSKLKVLHSGIPVGTMKGKEILPAHALAMSLHINSDAFSCLQLNREQAIAYLRREALPCDVNAMRGYCLLTYQDVPLGFAKYASNRLNNLYPQEWRIRNQRLKDI